MSSRAAWRLESLGFEKVFRYTPGKVDWLANGWPIEGQDTTTKAVDIAHRDVPTCSLNEPITAVRQRIDALGWDVCVVVNEQQIVLGQLDSTHLDHSDKTAEQSMDCAPRTYRLDASLESMARYMDRHKVGHILVTESDGRLVGLAKREDINLKE